LRQFIGRVDQHCYDCAPAPCGGISPLQAITFHRAASHPPSGARFSYVVVATHADRKPDFSPASAWCVVLWHFTACCPPVWPESSNCRPPDPVELKPAEFRACASHLEATIQAPWLKDVTLGGYGQKGSRGGRVLGALSSGTTGSARRNPERCGRTGGKCVELGRGGLCVFGAHWVAV